MKSSQDQLTSGFPIFPIPKLKKPTKDISSPNSQQILTPMGYLHDPDHLKLLP